ncbi:hypothetical protein WL98_27195 [Burkholderia multivorans]|nr:hypothetical protein WL98_27195 [Burkholderia multivorans]
MDVFVGVMTSSTGKYSHESPIWQIYRRIIDGNFPVSVFFVLSGYVLLLAFEKTRSIDVLTKASVKRYFRLMPVVFVSVMLTWAISKTIGFHNVNAANAIGGHDWFASHFLGSFSFLHSVWIGVAGSFFGEDLYQYNFPLWTIRIEMFGSLLLFAIAALIYKNRNFWLLSTAFAAVSIYAYGDYGIYYSLFLAGAILLKHPRLRAPAWMLVPAMILGAENVWTPEALFFAAHLRAVGVSFDVVCHALAAILMVGATLNSSAFQAFLSCTPVRLLGKLSFAMYAFHAAIMSSVGAWLIEYGQRSIYPRAFAGMGFIATFAATIILSNLAYEFIDRGAQKSSGRIADALLGLRNLRPERRPDSSRQLP